MIYQRQKILLTLLKRSPIKNISKIQLLKWLFLLREEENLDQYVSFYDFFPYKYGPFSFLVYRDIAELERFGWVRSDRSSIYYTIPEDEFNKIELPSNIIHAIGKILGNYGKLPQQSLLKYVYGKYPWYASRSVAKESKPSDDFRKARLAIYSIGYEGMSIDGFLDEILKSGIQTVIDSRNNPISRKYGFSKDALEGKCLDIGVKYYQFSEVGIPSEVRKKINDRQDLWNFYVEEVLKKHYAELENIAGICENNPSALICFEGRPEECHRHILAKELSMKTGLTIIHYINGRWINYGEESKDSYNC